MRIAGQDTEGQRRSPTGGAPCRLKQCCYDYDVSASARTMDVNVPRSRVVDTTGCVPHWAENLRRARGQAPCTFPTMQWLRRAITSRHHPHQMNGEYDVDGRILAEDCA